MNNFLALINKQITDIVAYNIVILLSCDIWVLIDTINLWRSKNK